MSNAHQAQTQAAQAPAEYARGFSIPGENLSIQETLRVMDVARAMRQQRETAEEMFRRHDVRRNLREKLIRTARMSGDDVTEVEIDAAIEQYMETLHTYEDPKPGLKRFVAHCWIWRHRIMAGAAAAATVVAAAGGLWFLFG